LKALKRKEIIKRRKSVISSKGFLPPTRAQKTDRILPETCRALVRVGKWLPVKTEKIFLTAFSEPPERSEK
jgi:hypothetical protein